MTRVDEVLTIIKKEQTLYQKLFVLMEKETEAIESFAPDKLQRFAQQREELLVEIAGFIDKRRALEKELLVQAGLEPGENATLTEAVSGCLQGRQLKEALDEIAAYRELVGKVRIKATELNRLVGWSMSVVNGSISIIRSCAEAEVSGYGAKGNATSSYHPRYSREAVRLKEA